MTANSKLYDKVTLTNAKTKFIPGSKTYRGFSTINAEASSFTLYDLQLIKQDLINNFHIRMGERLEQPEFGTIIWDVIFEPLTEDLKRLIIRNVEQIINYDPRTRAEQVIVTSYDTGLQIECVLTYYPYNIQEALQFRFDQENGIVMS
jgi:phage baseplate assembly protein W